MRTTGRIARKLAPFLVCALALSTAAAGDCLRVEVDETMLLPDGQLVAGGELRICRDRAYSPVSALHTISVDGHAVGFFQSRLATGVQEDGEAAFVLFQRTSEFTLRLIGYASAGSDGLTTYRFALPTSTDGSVIELTKRSLRSGSLYAGLQRPEHESRGLLVSDLPMVVGVSGGCTF